MYIFAGSKISVSFPAFFQNFNVNITPSRKFISIKNRPIFNVSYDNAIGHNVLFKVFAKNFNPYENVRIDIEKYLSKDCNTLFQSCNKTNKDGNIYQEILLQKESNFYPYDSILVKCMLGLGTTSERDTVVKMFPYK